MKKRIINSSSKTSMLVIFLMLIFLLKGIVYAIFITPPTAGASPDDVGHISYIQYIASQKSLPILFKSKLEDTTYKAYSEFNNRDVFNYKNLEVYKEQFSDSSGDNWIVQHPPLYYLILTPIYLMAKLFTNKLYILIIVLRIATIPFGVLSLYFLNKLMDILKTKNIVRHCILCIFVFSAPIQYYFSNITNDSLLIFLCIMALYFLLKYIYEKEVKAYYIFVILCGLIILTKYTGGLVVLCYILFLIYKLLSKDGLVYTIKKLMNGAIIGLIIIAPIIIRNIYLYGNPFQTYDIMTNNYHFNFVYFIKNMGYFDEIYRNIISIIGWDSWIIASWSSKIITALILSLLGFLTLISIEDKSYQIVVFCLYITLIPILNLLLNTEIATNIAISSFIILLINLIYNNHMEKNKKDVIVFFSITSLLVFFTFMYQHYIIACDRGRTGAMWGRYYYIILFPVLYLVFNILEEVDYKILKYVPAFLTFILLFLELQTISTCLINW